MQVIISKDNLRPVVVRCRSKRGGWEECKGYFHCWSSYADEDGNTPIAIIELMDGQCVDMAIEKVKFTDRE